MNDPLHRATSELPEPLPKSRRPVLVAVATLLVAVTVGSVAGAVRWKRAQAKTSIAIAPAPPAPRAVRAEGRVIAGPAGQVTVGAEMLGTISKVLVSEGMTVKAGDLLIVFRGGEHAAAASE